VNFAVIVGKLLRSGIRLFRRGGGSAFPGGVAGKLDPKLIERSINFERGNLVVTGSAGKSSTTKLLVEILRAHNLRVFTNPSTANIEQGLVSAILQQSDLRGRLQFDIAVLEVDEAHGAALAEKLNPQVSVFTNLMVDQIDRFVDPDLVLEKLQRIRAASDAIVVNADDANLDQLGPGVAFGANPQLRLRHDYPEYAEAFAQPTRTPQLEVVGLVDQRATMRWQDRQFDVDLKTPGMHVALNTAAALLSAIRALGSEFSLDAALRALRDSEPVFARDERLDISGTSARLMLVQNPGSFRLNLAILERQPERLMIAIGSDVHDPAWLWSVDFSGLTRVDLVSGSNAHELALRLSYQGVDIAEVNPATDAVDQFLEASRGQTATMIVSADAMRRLRRHLKLAR
jgi:lipid II isoglutaminyl synthase (glutamine-hydrolysing)